MHSSPRDAPTRRVPPGSGEQDPCLAAKKHVPIIHALGGAAGATGPDGPCPSPGAPEAIATIVGDAAGPAPPAGALTARAAEDRCRAFPHARAGDSVTDTGSPLACHAFMPPTML